MIGAKKKKIDTLYAINNSIKIIVKMQKRKKTLLKFKINNMEITGMKNLIL